jgi:ribonuclease E
MGRISGFGLLEMSRQRLRPGMIEATTKPCPHCHGTGLVRSDDNLALSILRELEEEGVRNRSGEVLVKAPIAIVNYLMNEKREHIARIELRYGMAVRVEADMHMISPNFTVEKFKTATRKVVQVAPAISIDMSQMPDDDIDIPDEEDEVEAVAVDVDVTEGAAETPDTEARGDDDGGKTRKKRRRRRRRRGGSNGDGADQSEGGQGQDASDDDDDNDPRPYAEPSAAEPAPQQTEPDAVPATAGKVTEPAGIEPVAAPAPVAEPVQQAVTEPEPVVEQAPEPVPEPVVVDAEPEVAPVAPVAEETPKEDAEATMAEPERVAEPEPELVSEPAAVPASAAPEAPPKPKKRGWWSS